MLLDYDEVETTDELSFGLWLCMCIDMFNVWNSTLPSLTTRTSCVLACDWVKTCIMYVCKLDDTDELSFVLLLCIEVFDVCNLTFTSWTTRTRCLVLLLCIEMFDVYIYFFFTNLTADNKGDQLFYSDMRETIYGQIEKGTERFFNWSIKFNCYYSSHSFYHRFLKVMHKIRNAIMRGLT